MHKKILQSLYFVQTLKSADHHKFTICSLLLTLNAFLKFRDIYAHVTVISS